MVADIGAALAAVRAAGLEPIRVNLARPAWKEAFIHPRDAQGIVVQIAQQSGPPPPHPVPGDLPGPGPASAFALTELHVADLARARELFGAILGGRHGEPGRNDAGVAELTWPNGSRLRLTRNSGGSGIARLLFTRTAAYTASEREAGAALAGRLRVPVSLGGPDPAPGR